MKYNRWLLVALSVALVLVVSLPSSINVNVVHAPNPPGILYISNNILGVTIQNSSSSTGIGTFTIRTDAGHSNPDQDVLYGGAAYSPWSSFTTIRVVDTNNEYVTTTHGPTASSGYTVHSLDGYSPVAMLVSSTEATVSWTTSEHLLVTLLLKIHGTTLADTMVEMTVTIRNNDEISHSVGVRHELDIMIDGNDNSWIRPWMDPNTPQSWNNTETDWVAPSFKFWETTNDPSSPLFSIYGSTALPNVVPAPTLPDRLVYAGWASSYGTAYDYTPSGQSGMDSAVLYYYNPVGISPGGQISRTAYLTTVVQSTLASFAWSVDSAGNNQSTFLTSDNVYVKGNNFPASTNVAIYLIPDGQTATSANAVASALATTTASGDLPNTLVWSQPLTPGQYDIWVDVNKNGVFDTGDVWNNQAGGIYAFTVTPSEVTMYPLTMYTVGQGTVLPGNSTYPAGTAVNIEAISTLGWTFAGWSGGATGLLNTTITMNGPVTVTATFSQDQYTLSVTAIGSGSIIADPSQTTYAWGTIVTLTASADAGWTFAGWSGDASGTVNPTTVNMTGNKAVTATFTQNTLTLSVSVVGHGSVNLNNTGPYSYGDVVQLTAVPAAGWSFAAWSGDIAGSANPTTLTITGNGAVTAIFYRNVYTLIVNVIGQGYVHLNDSGPYHYGDVVQLTAYPATGWSFGSWSGDLLSSMNPANLVVTGNMSVTGIFTHNTYTLAVSVVGQGSVTLNNTGPYHYGDVVMLTAVPASGWSLDHWTGDLTGSANPTDIFMDSNKVVTAYFTQSAYTLIVNVVGQGSVSLNNTGPYNYGDVVQLTAVPAAGWSFAAWSGDLMGSANPATLAITGSEVVTANFIHNVYGLTINVVGQGHVDLNNTGPYHYGDVVELTAVPAHGWSFVVWSGDASGTANPVTVKIAGNMAVTATFAQGTYTLTVTTVGSGSVTLNNTGPYHYGDVVQLTALPAAGWNFGFWSGNLAGSANPATLAVTGNEVVIATFVQSAYSLTINVVGQGSVNLNNTGSYRYGDVVQLTAVPGSGWSFGSWSGDLVGSANPATLTITGNNVVAATFVRNVYTLTVNVVGHGSVSLNNTGPYHYGDIVALTAVPAAGWSFSSWSGALSGLVNPATLAIDGDKSVTATFTQNVYALTVNVVGQGNVILNNTGPYHYGDIVELTAVPALGWSFTAWSGDASGTASPTTVNMTGDKSVTATFAQNTYTLTITTVGSGSVSLNNTGPYHYGDVVQLTAVPAAGWSFSSWSGALSGLVNPATLAIDGDKSVTATFTQILVVKACIEFKPEVLNLKSEGKWITCFIRLPEGYDVADIDVSTVMLNGTIPASKARVTGECGCGGARVLEVKFDRAEVQQLILSSTHLTKGAATVGLTVTGSLKNGTQFQGTDSIKATLHHHHEHRCSNHHGEFDDYHCDNH